MLQFIEGLVGYACDNVAYDVLSPAPVKGIIAVVGGACAVLGVKAIVKDKIINHYIEGWQAGKYGQKTGEKKATNAVKILDMVMQG